MHSIAWQAIYDDGTLLDSRDADKGYADIDRDKLVSFCLIKDKKIIVKVHLDKGQRLIWRKREFHTTGKKPVIFHLVGWQETIGGENSQMISVVHEDGRVDMISKWREDHPLFSSIELLPEEASH